MKNEKQTAKLVEMPGNDKPDISKGATQVATQVADNAVILAAIDKAASGIRRMKKAAQANRESLIATLRPVVFPGLSGDAAPSDNQIATAKLLLERAELDWKIADDARPELERFSVSVRRAVWVFARKALGLSGERSDTPERRKLAVERMAKQIANFAADIPLNDAIATLRAAYKAAASAK